MGIVAEPLLPDFDNDEDDRTAVVRLRDIARGSAVARDRHLLVRVEGEELGQLLTLDGDEIVIGRLAGCSICIPDAGISRKHCRIVRVGDGYVLEDLDSANGTYVGGEQVRRHRLSDGDVIQLGSAVVFRYAVTDADQHAMLQHLYNASVTDSLTGAFNREYFDSRLEAELAYVRRHGVELGLFMIDVDHFKLVNDQYGHQAGDAVLVALAKVVRMTLRSEDVFCRYGGEEFVAILRTTELTVSSIVAERVRIAIEAMVVEHAGRRIPVTASLGVATAAECANADAAELIGLADRRLYAAKHAGRNRIKATG